MLAAPDNERLHSAFERNARAQPDTIALWFKGEDSTEIKWSYSTLNRLANRLARAIMVAGGDVADTAIPLCIEKTPELYVGILGILKVSKYCQLLKRFLTVDCRPAQHGAPSIQRSHRYASATSSPVPVGLSSS
jgi:acyl-CoA synthetase (AMP-forming)/AMP-acid ligase II